MASTHPSVLALLAVHGGDDPDAAIRQRARALVAEVMDLGWEGPPFSMRELASVRGYRVSESDTLSGDQDAFITAGQIVVNASVAPVRQRYSIAHEIGHTLFPDFGEEIARQARIWLRPKDESELEQLCQSAAAEFLMPVSIFGEMVRAKGRGII